MCLTSSKEVSIAEVEAFKVFTRDSLGLLQSTFVPTFKCGLKYPSNERIRVDEEDASDFAFSLFKNATSIDRAGRRKWNMLKVKLILLPVTMYDVVTEGKYHVTSDDPQSLDGYYAAFQSKEIEVHDTKETRDDFHREVMGQYLRLSRHSMSFIEKEAFSHFVPELESVLQ